MISCKLVPVILTLTAIIAVALSAVPSIRDSQAVLRNPIENDGVIPPKPIGNDQNILAVLLYRPNNTGNNCTGSGTEFNLTGDICQMIPSSVVMLQSTKCKQVVIYADECGGDPIVLPEEECIYAEFHDAIQPHGCND